VKKIPVDPKNLILNISKNKPDIKATGKIILSFFKILKQRRNTKLRGRAKKVDSKIIDIRSKNIRTKNIYL